jgi:FIMAH domain
MIDTNSIGKITYNDRYPEAYDAGKNYVISLEIGGVPVDFTDASKYYLVSTVNYLAAGSCNFNDGGVSLWPLSQIVNDTQYYVRDAVIDYITAMGTVSPAIEGRLVFNRDTTGPTITVNAPVAKFYGPKDKLILDYSAEDLMGAAPDNFVSGLASLSATLDGVAVTNGQKILMHKLAQGDHVLLVTAVDKYGNVGTKSVTFQYDSKPPVIIITVPADHMTYLHTDSMTLDFKAVDAGVDSGTISAKLEGKPVTSGQVIDLMTLHLGQNTLVVKAEDALGNGTLDMSKFYVKATIQSLKTAVNRFYSTGKITKPSVYNDLIKLLDKAQSEIDDEEPWHADGYLYSFMRLVDREEKKSIEHQAAHLLLEDAEWVIDHLPRHHWR